MSIPLEIVDRSILVIKQKLSYIHFSCAMGCISPKSPNLKRLALRGAMNETFRSTGLMEGPLVSYWRHDLKRDFGTPALSSLLSHPR